MRARVLLALVALGAVALAACTTASKNDKGDGHRVGADELWRSARPPAGAPLDGKVPVFDKAELKNGMSLLVLPVPGSLAVSARVVVRAGTAADGKEPGLAALTWDLLDEGADKLSGPQLADELEKLGTALTIDVQRDTATVGVDVVKRNADAALEILAGVIKKPAFAQADFDRVRAEALTDIKVREADPRAEADDLFDALALGERDETATSLDKISRERVRRFWAESVGPKSAALVLVGDVTVDEAKALAEKHFGKWPALFWKAPKPAAEPKARTALTIAIADVAGAPLSSLRIGHGVLGPSDPDEAAVLVVERVLAMRLTAKLRDEKAWTSAVDTSVVARPGKGPLLVATDVLAANTVDAAQEILAQLELLRTSGVTEDELNRARDGLVKGAPGVLADPARAAAAAASLFDNGAAGDAEQKRVDALKSLKIDDVKKAAERALAKEDLVLVVAGDKASVLPKLKALGEVTEVAPSPPAKAP
ncbi:MAG TPA: pitrilysin family protein [Myxococcota bacterium]|jgi:predicted Zn-dependent peptidase